MDFSIPPEEYSITKTIVRALAYALTQAARAEARTSTEPAQAVLAQAGVHSSITVSEAHAAWRGILDTAGHIGADLIVMGSHGRSGLEKVVLGSVAQRVLSHASLPVMVVR